MGYRNKTYVIFDGDKDMWGYRFMRGWKKNENVDFDFYDAHETNKLLDGSSEETVKGKLRERLTIDFCINNGKLHFHRTHGKSEA